MTEELSPCPFCGGGGGGRMKSTNPRFSETDVTFAVKERLGWDDINVFPESVYIEHDCDHEEPYVVDGHVFYDRKAVRYVPERTCRVEEDTKRASQTQLVVTKSCSECGHCFGAETHYERMFEGMVLNEIELPSYCPNCGAQVEVVNDHAD